VVNTRLSVYARLARYGYYLWALHRLCCCASWIWRLTLQSFSRADSFLLPAAPARGTPVNLLPR